MVLGSHTYGARASRSRSRSRPRSTEQNNLLRLCEQETLEMLFPYILEGVDEDGDMIPAKRFLDQLFSLFPDPPEFILNPDLKVGDRVQIWATHTKNKTVGLHMARVRTFLARATAPTSRMTHPDFVAYHLSALIFCESGKIVNFGINTIGNISYISSVDITFVETLHRWALARHGKRAPGYKAPSLIAEGPLTQVHLNRLETIRIRSIASSIEQKKRKMEFSLSELFFPLYAPYQANICRLWRGEETNCVTFLADIFDDLINCDVQGIYVDPLACRSISSNPHCASKNFNPQISDSEESEDESSFKSIPKSQRRSRSQ